MNSFFNSINTQKIIKILIALIALFAIFPFVFLAQYNVPGASDDLMHGFFHTDKSYIDGIVYWYKAGYNGRFSNALFMLIPGRPFLLYGFGKVFPIVMFGLLYASILFLIRATNGKSSWSNSLFFSLLLSLFFIAYAPSIIQYYWYSGATVYIIPAICYFFLLGVLFKGFNAKRQVINTLFIVILQFFIVGSNENWMIIDVFTIAIFALNKIIAKEKLRLSSYVVIIWAIAMCLLMILAPGTTHRITMEGEILDNAQAVPSLILSFFQIGSFFKAWFIGSSFLLACLALMIISSKKSETNTISNKLGAYSIFHITILFFIILMSGIAIMLYSLGHFNPIRLRGLLPTFFVASLVLILLFYKLSQSEFALRLSKYVSTTGAYVILLIVVILSVANSQNVKNAYWDIVTKNAKIQAEESKWVLDYIKNSPEQELFIPQIEYRSKTLYPFRVPDNREGWLHWVVTRYFNKKTVMVDVSMSLNQFIFYKTHDGNCMEINKTNCYSKCYNFLIDDIYNSPDSSLLIKASINRDFYVENTLLVFECENFWKGHKIKDLIDSESDNFDISFKQKIPIIPNYQGKTMKVYFLNSDQNPVQICNIEVNISQ